MNKKKIKRYIKKPYYVIRFLIDFLKICLLTKRQIKKQIKKNRQKFSSSLENIIVVSREASLIGVPILPFSICRELVEKYNVFSILLRRGEMIPVFHSASSAVLGPYYSLKNNFFLAELLIKKMTKWFKFKFAIVNRVGSRVVLPVLSKFCIPAIPAVFLIYEILSITTHIKSAVFFNFAKIVFSSELTLENAILKIPKLSQYVSYVIPQGVCKRDFLIADTNKEDEDNRIKNILRPENLSNDEIIITGIGNVDFRKGVDLFLDCAKKVVQALPGRCCKFFWFGEKTDEIYFLFLKDIIYRLGLKDKVFFIDPTISIDMVYKLSDIIIISSRLDLLPNIAIDAMFYGVPLVCFDKTTEIADILIENGFEKECVAPYLDTTEMAEKISAIILSKGLQRKISDGFKEIVKNVFNMKDYIDKIEKLALDFSFQQKNNIKEIEDLNLLRNDYFRPWKSPKEAAQIYAWAWATGGPKLKKPFPGFHPGIFREQWKGKSNKKDPLLDYLDAKRPAGPWQYEVISNDTSVLPISNSLRIALHLHIYYADLFQDIFLRLKKNSICPDLFISVPSDKVKNQILPLLSAYSGKIHDIKVVPNRGRDIGSLLIAFGKEIENHYDIIGHIHTKKSKGVINKIIAKNWFVFCIENLLGGKYSMADRIIGYMNSDPSIGLIFPDDPNIYGWDKDRDYAESLADKMGIKQQFPHNFNFPVGTMFWARVKALSPLFDLNLGYDDYPLEPLPNDGTMLHAIERLLPFIASSENYRSVLTNVRGITR